MTYLFYKVDMKYSTQEYLVQPSKILFSYLPFLNLTVLNKLLKNKTLSRMGNICENHKN